jgi:biopolymer transport protein ExbD
MRKRFSTGFIDDNDLINLTPLLDVLFVVLILFIIIAPLTKLDRVEVTESSSKSLSASSMTDIDTIHICLHEDNTLSVNGKALEKHTLKILLQELKKGNKELVPRLVIDKKSSFGAFSETKDLIEECGFAYLDLVVKSKHS